MNKTIVSFVIAAVLLGACTREEAETEILVESFPVEETIDGTRVDLTDSEFLSNGMYLAGDYLVFQAIKNNYFLQVYDREFNLVDKLLYRGEGPEELPNAIWNGQWSGSPANPAVLVYSDAKKRVASLNIHPFDTLTTVCDIPVSEWISPTTIYQTSDTTFAGITLDMTSGADLFIYNSNTRTQRRIPRPFKFKEGPESFYTSQQVMAFNRTTHDICCAYNSFPSLVVYDKDFNVRRIVNVGEKVNTELLSNTDEYPSFCMVSYYKGLILAMLVEGSTGESRLLVFDSDGEPRASYATGKSIGFVADESAQRLLTVKYDTDEDVIYLDSYPMPELLK
ncbi:MAG: hypothetical protein NC336_07380 [Clostridium sp.]|nr:hypothetical protein [Clostridium sp.]